MGRPAAETQATLTRCPDERLAAAYEFPAASRRQEPFEASPRPPHHPLQRPMLETPRPAAAETHAQRVEACRKAQNQRRRLRRQGGQGIQVRVARKDREEDHAEGHVHHVVREGHASGGGQGLGRAGLSPGFAGIDAEGQHHERKRRRAGHEGQGRRQVIGEHIIAPGAGRQGTFGPALQQQHGQPAGGAQQEEAPFQLRAAPVEAAQVHAREEKGQPGKDGIPAVVEGVAQEADGRPEIGVLEPGQVPASFEGDEQQPQVK